MMLSERPTRGGLQLSLWAAIVVLASILLVLLALPLLAQSIAMFALVAGVGWLVVFGAMALLTQRLRRETEARQASEKRDGEVAPGVDVATSSSPAHAD